MISIGILKGIIDLEDRFSSKLTLAATSLDKFADGGKKVGEALTYSISAPLIALGALAVKTFMDFDGAMKGVEAALAPTQPQLEKLEAAAMEWGAKTKFSATEAALALGEIGKAGYDVDQSIKTLPAVLNLATISGMGLAETATLTSDSLHQMNMSIDQATHLNDILAKGAQISTVDVAELGRSFTDSAGPAIGLGMSLEELTGSLAAFGNAGLKGERAGTALRNIITDIAVPTKGMTEVMAKFGIESLKSADGTIHLGDVLQILKDKGAKAEDAMKAFGDRSGPVMVTLLQQTGNQIKEMTSQLGNVDGAAKKAAEVIMKGLTGAVENMRGSMETAGIAIGKVLAPSLIQVADLVGKAADFITNKIAPAFASLPEPIKLAALALAALAAAVGPALIIFAKIAEAVVVLTPYVTEGSTAFALMTNPVTILIGALAALAFGLRYLTGSWDGVLQVVTLGTLNFQRIGVIWDVLSTVAQTLWGWLSKLAVVVGEGLGWAFQNLLLPAATVVWEVLSGVASFIGSVAMSAWEGLMGIISAVADSGFGHLVIAVGEFIAKVAGWAIIIAAVAWWERFKVGIDIIVIVFGYLYRAFVDIASFIGNVFLDHIKNLWNAFSTVVQIVAGPTIETFKSFINILNIVSQKAADVVNWMNKNIPGFEKFSGGAKDAGQAALEWGKGLDTSAKAVQGVTQATAAGAATATAHAGAIAGQKSAVVNLAAQLVEAKKAVAALTEEDKANIQAGITLHKSVDDISKSTKLASSTIQLYEDSLKKGTAETKKAAKETENLAKADAKMIKEGIQQGSKVFYQEWQDRAKVAEQAAEKIAKAIQADYYGRLKIEEETADMVRKLTMNEFEYELDSIIRKGEARKKDFEGMGAQAVGAREAIDRQTALTAQQMIFQAKDVQKVFGQIASSLPMMFGGLEIIANGSVEKFQESLEGVTKKTTNWKDALSTVGAAFTQLAQTSKGALSGLAEALGSALNAANLGAQAGAQFSKGLEDALAPGKKNWGNITTNITAGILGGIGAVSAATDPSKSLASRMLGGAAAGAASAAAVATAFAAQMSVTGQVYLIAAAAVVGLFVGYFRGQKARREMEIVGSEWGQSISKGLKDKIDSTSLDMGFGRVESSLFHMKDFISEAGGLNNLNFDRFVGKLHDVFSALETGAFSMDQATRVIDENFGAFAQHVVEEGGIASTKFQEIIALNATMGMYSGEVLKFIGERTSVVSDGLAAMVGPLQASIDAWGEAMDQAEKTGKVLEGTDQFIVNSAAEIDNLGVIAVGAFGAARAAGLSYYDAAKQMQSGLSALGKAQAAIGIQSDNIALQDLIHFNDRIVNNETLVKATEALGTTMEGLSQIGKLNAETLAAVETQGMTTYGRLTAAGFTENEALALMSDYLIDVIEAHEALGTPIDDNTAALINQADSMGLLKKDGKSMTDVLQTGFDNLTAGINELILTLGGVPLKFDEIGNAINKIPKKVTTTVTPELDMSGLPDGWVFPGKGTAEQPEGFEGGTHGLRDFGAGTMAILHKKEAVVTEAEWNRAQKQTATVAFTQDRDRNVRPVYINAPNSNFGDYASQQNFKRTISDVLLTDQIRFQTGTTGFR